jgi:hypothetical protein
MTVVDSLVGIWRYHCLGLLRRFVVGSLWLSRTKKYDSTVFEPVLLIDWAGFEPATSAHQQLFSRLSLFITYLKGAELWRENNSIIYPNPTCYALKCSRLYIVFGESKYHHHQHKIFFLHRTLKSSTSNNT